MSSHELFISSSLYVPAPTPVLTSYGCYVPLAFSFCSGAVLKFDRFYHSSFFSTKLRLVSL